jgi:sugar/nucleoside kinase (ribokinase family)
MAWSRAARARGIPVVFDGGSWKAGTEELLKHIDSAICSADFMPPGCSTGDDAIKHLQERGVVNIAITNGAEPICFVSGNTSGAISVRKVPLVDTMGAGDILHGAFCHYFSMGSSFVDALREAAQIATDSCRFRGTRAWMTRATKSGL